MIDASSVPTIVWLLAGLVSLGGSVYALHVRNYRTALLAFILAALVLTITLIRLQEPARGQPVRINLVPKSTPSSSAPAVQPVPATPDN